MFTGFNDAARLVMRLAEGLARCRRDALDTDDLLLALVQLHDCVAARVLARCGITLDAVRRAARTPGEHGTLLTRRPPLTPAVVTAVRLATAAASERLGHPAVGTGHLLLGLLEEGQGAAFTTLCRLGVVRLGANLSRVAEHVVAEMRRGRPDVGP
ncbi:MAG: Clp protease N-terminal domain-containing protein [Gemmataceae bacterium]